MTISVIAADVHKAYRDGERRIDVLRGVDLRVEPGESVAVVGQSGTGKSTLLHLLGALDNPDRGTIEIGGERLDSMDPEALAGFRNRTIGFVFQFQELLADFTALENVLVPGRIAGQRGQTLRAKGEDLLDEVGLSDRADHFPSQLSGGEQQRVALCRALLLEPPLLLADEPTGNLDPKIGGQVFELLVALQKRRGTTALVVTHNHEIASRCGRLLTLKQGVLRD
ncbi:MAG: ABC transporter ATP-binding protein [Thermoanaerobaculia bacterium]